MAITGTGTELDPFIVHSYDEIKEAAGCHNGSTTMYYMKLMNDIDCNSYGTDWEWEMITLANSSSAAASQRANTLDLNGHTIKNVYIKNDNFLFGVQTADYNKACIKNGKILNVFGNSPKGCINSCSLLNVSTSLELGSPTENVFGSCKINNCAIYAVVINIGSHYLINHSGQGTTVKNVDIYCELGGITSTTGVVINSSSSQSYADSVRIDGKLMCSGSALPTVSSQKMLNSVVNVDLSGLACSNISGNKALIGGSGDNTTVVNTSILATGNPNFTYTAGSGNLLATSSEIGSRITVGADLRSLGFLVVNAEE